LADQPCQLLQSIGALVAAVHRALVRRMRLIPKIPALIGHVRLNPTSGAAEVEDAIGHFVITTSSTPFLTSRSLPNLSVRQEVRDGG
jgi:hypothetical protein